MALAALLFTSAAAAMSSVSVVFMAFGLSVGTLAPPLLAGRLFGNKEYGSIYGLANVFYMAGCRIGPMISSTVRTANGRYNRAWYGFLGFCVLLVVST